VACTVADSIAQIVAALVGLLQVVALIRNRAALGRARSWEQVGILGWGIVATTTLISAGESAAVWGVVLMFASAVLFGYLDISGIREVSKTRALLLRVALRLGWGLGFLIVIFASTESYSEFGWDPLVLLLLPGFWYVGRFYMDGYYVPQQELILQSRQSDPAGGLVSRSPQPTPVPLVGWSQLDRLHGLVARSMVPPELDTIRRAQRPSFGHTACHVGAQWAEEHIHSTRALRASGHHDRGLPRL